MGRKKQAKPDRKKFFISLRVLATLSAAGLVGVTVLLLVWVNEQNIRRYMVQEARTQLVLEARNLAISGSDALLSPYPELTLIPLAKDMVAERPEIVDVVILNHKSEIQGSPDSRSIGLTWQRPPGVVPIDGGAVLKAGERLSESASVILAECPVHYDDDSDLGWVAVVLDKGFIEARVRQTRIWLMTVAAIFMGAALIVTPLMMSQLFRPLARVREGLARIGRGDLDSPMEINDFTEMGLLASSVNEMAGQLQASRRLAEAQEQEVIDTQKEVIITLGQVVESRSSETANHTVRVGDMSYELALLAGLPTEEAELIRMASPMHDVGKIGIPDRILNKPGKLTEVEYTEIKRHSEIGYGILNKSERSVLKAAAVIAYQHHEQWDGQGYPRGLKGEEIHIYGRIVALVDVFDALFSNRVYRPAFPLDKVLQIIKEGVGRQFDPRLSALFLANLPRFLAIAEHYEDVPEQEAAPAVASQPVRS